ncbi:conserved hypothetical protein [Dehalogenimonas lykanthroporepellens BL-DC-9]|nr:conserved hypothetical protein [Dehalogenimonas lykanthroporepellens BL-DC-9]
MFGRNFIGAGQQRGAGFGFRGNSPPWPYVGRGRGGLPRCAYYGGSLSAVSPQTISRDEEIHSLKTQTEFLQKELANMEARMHELQKEG